MSGVCSIEHYVSCQTVSRGHILVFFNRHCSTMNLVKEKQGGLVPPGLKRWPFKLIKHFAHTTYVCHLLQVQRAAVLWTFSIWLIWSFVWGLQMGAAYSSLGWTKVLYATSLGLLGAKAKFLRRKPSVLVALEEISETCWPQSMLSVMLIPRYFADWTFSKVWLCSELSKRICLWCWCQVILNWVTFWLH